MPIVRISQHGRRRRSSTRRYGRRHVEPKKSVEEFTSVNPSFLMKSCACCIRKSSQEKNGSTLQKYPHGPSTWRHSKKCVQTRYERVWTSRLSAVRKACRSVVVSPYFVKELAKKLSTPAKYSDVVCLQFQSCRSSGGPS